MGGGWIRSVQLERADMERPDAYPFNLPAFRDLDTVALHPRVTFHVGKNDSGKSTLIEAIAVAAEFNAEGGSRNFTFVTRDSTSGRPSRCEGASATSTGTSRFGAETGSWTREPVHWSLRRPCIPGM